MRLAVLALALALGAPALAGCIQQANDALAANLEAGPAGVLVDEDGFAPRLFDGHVFGFLDVAIDPTFTVHAETYLPDAPLDAAAPEQYPTVIVMSPYFGAGQGGNVPGHPVYKWLVEELVPRGYAVVLADVAGTGGSGGCWDFMGPDEVASTVAMVEGIAAQDWSDGRVGMIGKSYDAMTQIMAASQAPEHLVTIVPVAPLTHAYAGLFMNGVHYGGGWMLTTTLYEQISITPPGEAQERYPGYAQHMAKKPACAGQNAALGNDPSGGYNAYFTARDFRPLAGELKASVLYMQGFLDPAVKPDNPFPFLADVPTDTKAWLGQWAHDYPNATFGGREDMYVTVHRWFDHYLKGVDNGIDRELGYDVQDSLGRWRHEDAWPPMRDARALTLHLGADGMLAAESGDAGAFSFGGPSSLQNALQGGAAGATTLVLGATNETMHVSGIPRLSLTVASDRPAGQVVAKLYENDGQSRRLVTQGAFNLLLAGGPDSPAPFAPGTALAVAFDLYPTDHVVAAGSALELDLLTTDAGWFNPDPWGATLTVATGADAGSNLTLPLIDRTDADILFTSCGSRIADLVPDCHDETLVDLGREEVGA